MVRNEEVLLPEGFTQPPGDDGHPDRYAVREGGEARYLCCVEAPEVRVTIEREAVAQEAAARKALAGTIFVDGAAQGPPFLDAERKVFNLDHHEGCVRPFTIAACEQALVLVLRGLDFGGRPWAIRVAEPDLDAVLAVWVLLNAAHLQSADSAPRRRLLPLIRLESVIDVHGLALAELSGLPPTDLAAASKSLDDLRRRELALKKAGAWSATDMLEYTATVLRRVDRLVFPPGTLPKPVDFEVLARADVAGDGLVLVCRAEQGIYEMESSLKQTYGRRLAVLALQSAPGRFTLRLVDPFLGGDLERVYDELNALDPAVAEGGWRNRWGGSAEIGGSPRGSGTALAPAEIAEACRQALRRPGRGRRVVAAAAAVAVTAAASLGGYLASWWAAGTAALPPAPPAILPFAAGFGVPAIALLVLFGAKRPRAFGLRRVVPGDWLYCVPVVLAAALAGGAWRASPASGIDTPEARLGLLFGLAVGAELLFRGVAHGILGRSFRVSHAGGRWFLSVPTLVSALLYAGVGALLPLAGAPVIAGIALPPWAMPVAAVVFGLTAGLARERSGSVLATLALHVVGLGIAELLG
jgi:hypothetical protein